MKQPRGNELRLFGLVLAAFVSLVERKLTGHWLGPVGLSAGALGIVGLGVPTLLRPIYRVMVILGGVLGAINVRLLLMLMYYLIFTPFALFFRLSGRDRLKLRREKRESLWENYDAHDKTLERYRRMF